VVWGNNSAWLRWRRAGVRACDTWSELCRIRIVLNRVRSACRRRSIKLVVSSEQKPIRMQRRKNQSTHCLSWAPANPHHDGEAYKNLANIITQSMEVVHARHTGELRMIKMPFFDEEIFLNKLFTSCYESSMYLFPAYNLSTTSVFAEL